MIVTHRAVALAALALAACAHAPPPPLRFDNDWIRPRLDDAAHAALRCLRHEPERVIEMEAAPDGGVRAIIHPFPASPEVRACADDEARRVHVGASDFGLRVLLGGDGVLLDPTSPRGRALTLRSRAIEQIAAVERCRQSLQARRPGADGRVGVVLDVGARGAITGAEVAASTLDAETDRCVAEAARALRLPEMPGHHRYSYFLAPRGVLVGAPDVDPLDRHDLARAVAALAPLTDPCLAGYRTPGRVVIGVTLGNDGVPIDAKVERVGELGYQYDEDARADRCLARAARALRVLPFDGPPATTNIPFTLR